MLLKEFCAENFEHVPAAIEKGAKRIELCDNLAVGGTTVSLGVMETTIQYCHEKDIPVMAIIRPRAGHFVYSDTELKIMTRDIFEAKKAQVDGVVLGCLTQDGWIDEEAMEELLDIANGLQVTFHMAFDAIPLSKQKEAIDWLVDHQVDRILTHGGPSGTPIEDNFAHLQELIAYANHRLIILPGGGITSKNATLVSETLNVHEVHGTKIV